MKPNRNGFYNLVEFTRLLEKIHDDDISLADILEYHRNGVPFHFKYGSIITDKDPVIEKYGLSLIPAKISFFDKYNKNMENANIVDDKHDTIKYFSTGSNHVQVCDKWIHRSIGYLLTSMDSPPLIQFSPGDITFSRVFDGSIKEGKYSTESIDSPNSSQLAYDRKYQPIMVNSFDVSISIKDCPPNLLIGESKINEAYGDLSAVELVPIVMESLDINPKAYKTTGSKYKKHIYDKCQKLFPDKFTMLYSSFSQGNNCTFNVAKKRGLIKKHQ